jgi:hypothetical protein|tara:strand:+ start:1502 stop:2248 length:747 start_codon:yes stop_codon:yes gene_type:complete
MSISKHLETLMNLKDDEKYYGEYGKQWLSNSDIYSLLNNPKEFNQPKKETKAMIEGRYFHTAMLEPEKLESFIVLDMASRNSKAYKEYSAEHDGKMFLLAPEVLQLDKVVDAMRSNFSLHQQIYEETNKFEVPMVKTIEGIEWKGKADIVGTHKLIDLKTTSDISKFKYSASKYNYDSQAFIYEELFNKPLEFYVIDKTTHQLSVFTPGEEFLKKGELKVKEAVRVYNDFFKEGCTNDIDQHINYEIL